MATETPTQTDTTPDKPITPPPNAIVHGQCGLWWTGNERSHASCCHRTFSSLSAFEAHRRGLRCNDPAAVGLVARSKPFGELWGWPAPEGGYAAVRDRMGEPDDHFEAPTVYGEVI